MATIEQCEGAKYTSYMREIDRIDEEISFMEIITPEFDEKEERLAKIRGSLELTRDILAEVLELERELLEVERR